MGHTKVLSIRKKRSPKTENVKEILAKVTAIRDKITRASGKWDAVQVIRTIRYAK